MIVTGTRGRGNKGTIGDHPNYSNVVIRQNIEKSPGYLKRFSVTQPPVRKYQLTLV